LAFFLFISLLTSVNLATAITQMQIAEAAELFP